MKIYGINPSIHDPIADPNEAKDKYGVRLLNNLTKPQKYSAVIVAQKHDYYQTLSLNQWQEFLKENGFIFDLKGIVPREINPVRI